MNSCAATTVPFGWTHRASSSAPTIMPVVASISGWKNGTMSPSSIARRSLSSRSIRSLVLAGELGVEWLDPVATARLGAVERGVRVGAAPRSTLAPCVGHGRPDADRRRQFASLGVHGLAEHTLQLVGDGDGRLLGRRRAGRRRTRRRRCGRRAPVGRCSARCDRRTMREELVATAVAERVVDRLEAVEVEEQHADRLGRLLADQRRPVPRTSRAG